MEIADLHVHSNYSDGSDSIEELLANIIKSGISFFALTDHDTVAGCKKMEQIVPKEIKFIPSVELTCKEEFVKCHILGISCDYTNLSLLNLIKKGKQLRKIKLESRIKYLKEIWDIELSQEELAWLYSRETVVKTHLANILVNRGLAKDNLSAMKKYLDGCKAGDTKFGGVEAIEAIVVAGGIPVWAHPLGGEGEIHITKEEFFKQFEIMKKIGIRGLECHYSRYNKDETDFLVNVAKENNLFITGGSDYHGVNKDIPLGKLNVDNKLISIDNITILNEII